jgi:RimJ/RimL family protein N-acetyltransferase
MGKRHIEPIKDNNVLLRLLQETDLPLTLNWRNQEHIRSWFFHSDLITPEQHRAWFDQYRDRDDDFVFIIEETEVLRRPIGQVSLYNIDWANRRAEFGRLMIGDGEAQGKGVAKRATRLLLEAAFGRFGLNEIYLEVIKNNASAVAIYRQTGFQLSDEYDNVLKMRLNQSQFEEAQAGWI